MIRRALPFQRMDAEGWLRLGSVALAACYLLQLAFEITWRNACGHLAIDYCAMWSAGRIANASGYAPIYDPTILTQIEASVTPPSTTYGFAVSPIAYLPVFIAPFQLLAKLDPMAGYWLWAVANLLILAVYLRFFVRKTCGERLSARLLTLFLLSLPVYWNFFNGQVNVWLVICVGETIRCGLLGQRLRAGLWLGGLWLKPQLLVLIVPILVLQRALKMIGGLALSSAALLGASWLMIGSKGFGQLAELWLGFGRGLPTNDVGIMMNWRMLGGFVSAVGGPAVQWIIIVAGLTATLMGTLYLWRGRIDLGSDSSIVAWLGLLAATTIFAWHSHVHAAMILLPPMLYLSVKRTLTPKVINYWVFLPAAFYFAAFIGAALMRTGALPSAANALLDFARGAPEFGLSIYLLIWAVKMRRPAATKSSTDSAELAGHIA